MARTKKSDATDATDGTAVSVRAAPETEVSVQATTKTPDSGTAGTGGGALLRAIRENPIPAGMVWAGLGWLALAAAEARRPATGAQQAVAGVATRTQETVGSVTSGARQRAQRVAGRTRGAIGVARVVATGALSTARERSAIEARRAQAAAQRLTTEKPEVLELAAVAAGAAVGLAVPATPQERQLVEPQRDQIIEKLDTAAAQAVEKVQQTIG